MAGPSWLAETFAATMLAVAGYCASRLIVSRLWRRVTELDGDGVHVFMGAAMAGMLVPRLNPLGAPVWELVFGISAAWFGWQAIGAHRGRIIGARQCPHPLPHLVESAAMLYMFVAMSVSTPGRPMTAMPSSGSTAPFPALAFALALFMIGYVVWAADRISPEAARAGGPLAGTGGRGARGLAAAAVTATNAAVTAGTPAARDSAARTSSAPGSAAGTSSMSGSAADRLPGPSTAAAGPGATAAGGPGATAAGGPGAMAAGGPGAMAAVRMAPARGCHTALGSLLAPRCAACCKIAMGVTMGYMLITML
jgi:Domain of unknown function (DUF5134)